MELNAAFANALKKLRKRRKLTQEDFVSVTSRGYMSQLERGMRSPTLDKVGDLAAVMSVHPASLVIASYLEASPYEDLNSLIQQIQADLSWRGLEDDETNPDD
ncbi:helix-turn-helix domain-containing protein [Pseudomonas frederiksbergensis]|jgi:transcriptional regulator with XRE-family HTH domain|uniref:helix-turn-helix domain-containing protein n=1 Tax=Pseudomonas TaxID=286 RepID=UPI001644929C|nr:helix-turn-helix transcriptional regulator [Pseudomonas sp. SWRI99]MBC3776381.1 helix-turn-helix transcriptional regulator [Pseudomonas sp. SWRI99]